MKGLLKEPFHHYLWYLYMSFIEFTGYEWVKTENMNPSLIFNQYIFVKCLPCKIRTSKVGDDNI